MNKVSIKDLSDEDLLRIGETIASLDVYRSRTLFKSKLEKITRISYNEKDGVDAEESVSIIFQLNIEREKDNQTEVICCGLLAARIIEKTTYDNRIRFYLMSADRVDSPKIWEPTVVYDPVGVVRLLEEMNLI